MTTPESFDITSLLPVARTETEEQSIAKVRTELVKAATEVHKKIQRVVEHVSVCAACYRKMTPRMQALAPKLPRRGFHRCPSCDGYGDVHESRLEGLLTVNVYGSVARSNCRRADLIRGMTAGPYRRTERLIEVEVWTGADRSRVPTVLPWHEIQATRFLTRRQQDKQSVIDALMEQGQKKWAEAARMRLYPRLPVRRRWGKGWTWKKVGVGCHLLHRPSGLEVLCEECWSWEDNRHNAECRLAYVLGERRAKMRTPKVSADRRGDRYCDAVLGPNRAQGPIGIPDWLSRGWREDEPETPVDGAGPGAESAQDVVETP